MRVLLACCSLACAQLQAAPHGVVIGADDEYLQVENGFPFGTLPQYFGYPGTRYQQVYSADSFPGPVEIERLVFYGTSNLAAPVLPGTIDFFLSVTDRGVNEISNRPFDSNLGPDTQLFTSMVGGFVLDDTQWTIIGRSFAYDPSQGNLLLDLRFNGAPSGHSGPFFAALSPASLQGSAVAPFSRWHDFGIGFDNYGLVTGFRFAISEPGTMLLLILGLVGVGITRRRISARAG